jgi:hypothetical protein
MDRRYHGTKVVLALRDELMSHVVGALRPTQNATIERLCMLQLRLFLWDQKLIETGEQTEKQASDYATLNNSFERQKDNFVASCKVREIIREEQEPPPSFQINVVDAVRDGDGSITRLERVASFTYGDPVPQITPTKRTRPRLDGAPLRSAAELRERLAQREQQEPSRELTDAEIAEKLGRVQGVPQRRMTPQQQARLHYIQRAGCRVHYSELLK